MYRLLYLFLAVFLAGTLSYGQGDIIKRVLPVVLDGQWGYINELGKVVLKPQYDTATLFFGDRFAFVRKNDRWGVLSSELELIQPIRYLKLQALGKDVFAATDEKGIQLFGAFGESLLQGHYTHVIPEQTLVASVFGSALDYHRLKLIKIYRDEHCGLIDHYGKEIVPMRYDRIAYYRDSLFLVSIKEKVGLVRWGGKELLPVAYDEIDKPNDDLIRFRQGKYWGYRLASGEQTAVKWKGIQLLGDNYIKLQTDTGQVLLTIPGQKLVSADYDDYYTGSSDQIVVRKNEKIGLIDLQNKLLIPPLFEEILYFRPRHFKVRSHGLYGLMNIRGDTLLSFSYHDILDYSESRRIRTTGIENSYCELILRGKMGLGDTLGRELVPPKFDHVVPIKERFILTKKGYKLGLYSCYGKLLAEPEYDRVGTSRNYGVVLRMGDCFALANVDSLLSGPENDRIVLASNLAKVYRDQSLKVFNFDDTGALDEVLVYDSIPSFKVRVPGLRPLTDIPPPHSSLNHYRWFFSQATGTYGLQHVENGVIGIKPTFERVFDTGLEYLSVVQLKVDTVVVQIGPYRFVTDRLYGLVDTKHAKMILEPEFVMLDIIDRQNTDPMRVLGTGAFCGMRPDGTYKLLHQRFANKTNVTFVEPLYNMVRTVATDGSKRVEKGNPGTGFKPLREHILELKKYNPFLELDSGSSANWLDDSVQIYLDDVQWNYMNSMEKTLESPDHFKNFRDLRLATNMYDLSSLFQNSSGQYGIVSLMAEEKIKATNSSLERYAFEGVSLYAASVPGALYGYVDTSGYVQITTRFPAARDFEGPYAAVQDSGRWGLITRDGLWHVLPKYNDAFSYKENIARVQGPTGYGYINESGQAITALEYDRAEVFSGGLAAVKKGRERYYINTAGEKILDTEAGGSSFAGNYAISKSGSSYGVINQEGKWVLKQKYDKILAVGPSKRVAVRKNKKYGLFDLRTASFVTNRDFDRMSPESEGMFAVYREGRWGYIDTLGHQLIPFQFRKAQQFQDGRAAVKDRGRWGVISTDGSWVLEAEWKSISAYQNGIAEVADDSNRYLSNSLGSILFNLHENRWVKSGNGYHILKNAAGRHCYVDQSGDPLFSTAVDFEEANLFEAGVARVKDGGKWGLIDEDGRWIMQPRYASIGPFVNGLARIEINPLMGIVNHRGDWLLEPKYNKTIPVDLDLYRVERNEQVGYVNRDGVWLWPLTR